MEQDGEWRTEGTDGAEGGEISRELMSRRASESSKDDAPVPPPAYSEAEQEEDKLVAATYDLLRVSCMKVRLTAAIQALQQNFSSGANDGVAWFSVRLSTKHLIRLV